jgi:hypothetical protein
VQLVAVATTEPVALYDLDIGEVTERIGERLGYEYVGSYVDSYGELEGAFWQYLKALSSGQGSEARLDLLDRMRRALPALVAEAREQRERG